MNRRWSVPVLGLLLAVSACASSDAEPRTLPPVSATPTATATPTVPPFPATKQGAADFVRLFIYRSNTVQTTGEVSLLADLYTPECASCIRFIRSMSKYWASGSVSGGVVTATYITPGLVQGSLADVTANVSESAARIMDRDGKTIKTIPAVRAAVLAYHLRRAGAGWQVIGFEAQT